MAMGGITPKGLYELFVAFAASKNVYIAVGTGTPTKNGVQTQEGARVKGTIRVYETNGIPYMQITGTVTATRNFNYKEFAIYTAQTGGSCIGIGTENKQPIAGQVIPIDVTYTLPYTL